MRNNGKGKANMMGSMNGMNFGFGMAETREEALQMMNMMMNMASNNIPGQYDDDDYDLDNDIDVDDDDWDEDEDEGEEEEECMNWDHSKFEQEVTGVVCTNKELLSKYLAKIAMSPSVNANLSFNDFLEKGGWKIKRDRW